MPCTVMQWKIVCLQTPLPYHSSSSSSPPALTQSNPNCLSLGVVCSVCMLGGASDVQKLVTHTPSLRQTGGEILPHEGGVGTFVCSEFASWSLVLALYALLRSLCFGGGEASCPKMQALKT